MTARPAWARAGDTMSARRAWARGDIAEAARVATRPRLRFLTSYVQGRYEEALAHHASLRLRPRSLDPLVTQALLHLGRTAEARACAGRHARADLRLRADHPLRSSLDRTTVVPFADHATAPYLAAVEVTLDGHRLSAVLDTGGTFVLMGTERAAALGIGLVPAGRAHHGTARTTAHVGTAHELALGHATLTNVPVAALPSLHGPQDVVIIGTNVLQQFLTTVDHPGGRLILSPRRHPPGGSAPDLAAPDLAASGRHEDAHLAVLGDRPEAARMPFFLWGDHYMFARGGFGTRHDLNYFIDSGLAYVVQDGGDTSPRQACLYASARQYRSFGVRPAGPHFTTDEPISLGPLRQHPHLVATAPGRRVPWASFGGVRIDGLLSHAFLSRYAWTLDFDRHEYRFHHPS